MNKTKVTLDQCYNKKKKSLDLYGKNDDWLDIINKTANLTINQIDLGFCDINPDNARLVNALDTKVLKAFHLQRSKLKPQTLVALFQGRTFPDLQILNLVQNPLGDQGLQFICRQNLPKLLKLLLQGNSISINGFSLVKDCSFSRLKSLEVSYNRIGCKGVKYITKANLPGLENLELINCNIQSEGLTHFSKGNWKSLQDLNITNNFIKLDGFYGLALSHSKLENIWMNEVQSSSLLRLVTGKWVIFYPYKNLTNSENMKSSIEKVLSNRFEKREAR